MSVPYWLGDPITTANTVTSNVTVQGTSTIYAFAPTQFINASVAAGGLNISNTISGTASTFGPVKYLSTGLYWSYADIVAASNAITWNAGDSIQFYVGNNPAYGSITAPQWPDLVVRPFYQAATTGATTAGQGNVSMNYSGWLALSSNSPVYCAVTLNDAATGSNVNHKYTCNIWTVQRAQ
jgi:hypothetical protein